MVRADVFDEASRVARQDGRAVDVPARHPGFPLKIGFSYVGRFRCEPSKTDISSTEFAVNAAANSGVPLFWAMVRHSEPASRFGMSVIYCLSIQQRDRPSACPVDLLRPENDRRTLDGRSAIPPGSPHPEERPSARRACHLRSARCQRRPTIAGVHGRRSVRGK